MENFKNALTYERCQQPIADDLYNRQFGNRNELERYDWDASEKNREMQRKDIDCSFLDRTQSPPQRIYVSEKFRGEDWGDMCIELYSDYDKNKPGSALISEADYYFYYIDPEYYRYLYGRDERDVCYGKAYRVAVEPIKQLAQKALEQFNQAGWKDEWLKGKSLSKKCLPENTKDPIFTYIKSYSNNKSWMGVCVCISWADIKKITEVTEYITVDLNHL